MEISSLVILGKVAKLFGLGKMASLPPRHHPSLRVCSRAVLSCPRNYSAWEKEEAEGPCTP